MRTRLLALVSAVVVLVFASQLGATAAITAIKFPCSFSHGPLAADPIVSPGVESAHAHLFFGNTSTNKDSTYQSMTSATTTCKHAGDTAGYWVPALYHSGGTLVPVRTATVYYSDEPQPTGTVTAFPPDFRMIAGFPHAFSSKQGSFWGWSCQNTDPLQATVSNVNCSSYSGAASYLALRVFFPMCGVRDANGIVTDSPDHRSHVVYPVGGNGSRTGSCPADHPVQLPRVRLIVNFAVSSCADCYLSSDAQLGTAPGGSIHADYWNTWDQPSLENLAACLNGTTNC